MIIIFGQKHYGKVDHVPGLFYVVTRFFHVWYFPLIPLQSHLILDGSETDNGFKGVRIRLSLKSVLLGWLRAVFVVMGVGGLILAGVAASEHKARLAAELFLVPAILFFGGLGLYWLTRMFNPASYERALALGEQVGLPAEYVEKSFAPPEPEPESYEQYEQRPN